eukprot:6475195-Amphidinium_carterae.1
MVTVDVGNCAMKLLRGGGFPPLVQGCCLVHPVAVHLQKAAQNGYSVDSKLDGDYAKLLAQSLVTSWPYGEQLEAYFDLCAYDETPMVSAFKHEVGKVECSRLVGYTRQLVWFWHESPHDDFCWHAWAD